VKKFLKYSVVIVIVIVGVLLFFLDSTEKADYYTLGDDKIPSVKLVLGETRKVVKSNTEISNNVRARFIEYTTDPNDKMQASNDMKVYFQYLLDKEGFQSKGSGSKMTYRNGVAGETQFTRQFGKDSVDAGKTIMLDIAYDSKGYTLDLKKVTVPKTR
jgi:hypothetical protein